MTLKEFNDFGRILDFTFDNAPVLGAPEPDDNYVTLVWNIHHKILGADWTHIAAISCLTISNPLDSLHDGTDFSLYPEPGSLLTDVEIRIFAKSIYQIGGLPTIVETVSLNHILIDHISDAEVEAFIRKSDDLLDKWNLEKNGRII